MNHDFITPAWYEQLAIIIKKAGANARRALEDVHTYTFKQDGSFATEADTAVEFFVKEKLAALFPEASFIAEESGEENKQTSWCWVIDPIDGTTNFSHQLPFFAVSISLTYNDSPIVAMTYDPMRDELFHARIQHGFFVNEKRYFVSKRLLSEAIAEVELAFEGVSPQLFCKELKKLDESVYAIRKLGSSCLSLAYIAAGRMDGFFMRNFKWWDVVAGILFVQEAGGRLEALEGRAVSRSSKTCVASNSIVFDRFKEILPLF